MITLSPPRCLITGLPLCFNKIKHLLAVLVRPREHLLQFALATGISTFFDNKHRRRMECGIWFHFGREARNADTAVFCATENKEVMSEACPELSEPSDPDLPAIERKIQSAEDDPCNR